MYSEEYDPQERGKYKRNKREMPKQCLCVRETKGSSTQMEKPDTKSLSSYWLEVHRCCSWWVHRWNGKCLWTLSSDALIFLTNAVKESSYWKADGTRQREKWQSG